MVLPSASVTETTLPWLFLVDGAGLVQRIGLGDRGQAVIGGLGDAAVRHASRVTTRPSAS